MSHIVNVSVKLSNADALRAALVRLDLQVLNNGQPKTFDMYDGAKAFGIGFKLPEWKYPVVVNTETGEAKFDNYKGHWGKQIELDKVIQGYSIEVTQGEAEVAGYNVEETRLENGDVELMMTQVASS